MVMENKYMPGFYGKITTIKDNSKTYATNFYLAINELEKWISRKEIILLHEDPQLLIWTHVEAKCRRLYFAGDVDYLKKSIKKCNFNGHLPLAVDIIGKENDISKISSIFLQNTFTKRTKLVRLSMNLKKPDNDLVCKKEDNLIINYLEQNHIDEVERMFSNYFDFCADQIPDREDIREGITNSEIIVEPYDKRIKGFVWFEKKKLTSLIRYWCVDKDFRGSGVGSMLMAKYFSLTSNSPRHLLWVKEENENALKRYLHYGYKPDGIEDLVLIWEDK